MQIDLTPEIDDATYRQLSELEGVSIYHTKNWHRFLSRVLCKPVGAITARTEKGIWHLPFVEKKPLFGLSKRVSLPFSHHIGPVVTPGFDSRISLQTFQDLSLEIHDELGVDGGGKSAEYDLTLLDLTQNADADAWTKSLPAKSIQYMLRRAGKEALSLERTQTAEAWNDFYRLVLETRHRQGSPVYPQSFFRELRDSLGEELCSLYLVRRGTTAISACVIFHYQGVSTYAYSASTSVAEHHNLGAGELALWTAICDAIARKDRTFDFGSTPRSLPALRSYKEKWGGKSRPLTYTYFPASLAEKGLKRNGMTVRVVAKVLQSMPAPLFEKTSPLLFRLI